MRTRPKRSVAAAAVVTELRFKRLTVESTELSSTASHSSLRVGVKEVEESNIEQ